MVILASMWSNLENGPFQELFWWKDLDRNRLDPLPKEEEERFAALPNAWSSLPQKQKDILNAALKETRRTISMLCFFPSPARLAMAIAWFAEISDAFIQMLTEKVPEALLVVCHYCVAMKMVEGVWWMEGKPENLLGTVMDELGGGWETWTKWPAGKVFGERGWEGFERGGVDRVA